MWPNVSSGSAGPSWALRWPASPPLPWTDAMADSPYARPPRRDRLIPWTFLLVLVVFGGLLVRHFLMVPAAPPPPADAKRQLRTVTLYFAAPDGTGLVAEGREIADC